MTSLSLDAGDWEVVDYTGNPVPGDPDAVSSLANQFLDQAGQAQERAERLTSVHASNEGPFLAVSLIGAAIWNLLPWG